MVDFSSSCCFFRLHHLLQPSYFYLEAVALWIEEEGHLQLSLSQSYVEKVLQIVCGSCFLQFLCFCVNLGGDEEEETKLVDGWHSAGMARETSDEICFVLFSSEERYYFLIQN